MDIMMKSILTTSLLVAAVTAFSPTPQLTPSFSNINNYQYRSSKTLLSAEGGAPQYDKIDGTLTKVETLAKGTVMLHIEQTQKEDKDIPPLEYKPGHVLALEIEQTDDDDSDSTTTTTTITNEKTKQDMAKNGGWMRGPYTVSRATSSTLDICIKVVGDKSKYLAAAKPNTPVKFGGMFKVPILDGVDWSSTKRVVLISTGVGVGPCVGAIEDALSSTTNESESESKYDDTKIELYASYKTEEEIVHSDHLDELVKSHPNKFVWKSIVTSENGRISSSPKNMELVTTTSSESSLTLNDTHYHLIGNGQMVNEWTAGLKKAGVPDEKVTTEMYFNHKGVADESAIENIANAISASCATPVVL